MNFKKSLKFTAVISLLFTIFALAVICFAGCSEAGGYEGQFMVKYELEGGKYQNCDYLTHYYDFKEDSPRLIADPQLLTKKDFIREGYTLEGWYRTKTSDGGLTVYTDKWDFAKDKASGEELTLYAHWRKNVKLTYNVCYRDDDGNLVTLDTYDVDEGVKFNDVLNYAGKRYGYTALGYTDEDGNPWNFDFRHPGGDADLAVNVVVNYIEGEYALVSTASELIANKSSNIYLLNDIDLDGENFGGFADYTKSFLGNGHTVSNFNLKYGATRNDLNADTDLNDEGGTLCISLFGNAKGAEIRGVKFKNVTMDVSTGLSVTKKIIVSPICVKITDTVISGVSFEGTFSCTRLPNNFNKEESLSAVTENAFYFKDGASVVENFVCSVTNNI